jgi:hypothetical protein
MYYNEASSGAASSLKENHFSTESSGEDVDMDVISPDLKNHVTVLADEANVIYHDLNLQNQQQDRPSALSDSDSDDHLDVAMSEPTFAGEKRKNDSVEEDATLNWLQRFQQNNRGD